MLTNYNPMLLADFYKLSHREQYPAKTEKVYSTWTCRGSRMPGVNKTVFFGLQKFIKEFLIDYFNDYFFNQPLEKILEDYKRVVKYSLGQDNPEVDHIIELHRLGHLPLKLSAVEEGTLVPVRVPCITIENTLPQFYWVTNFIETLMSAELWQSITSATIALEYRKIVEKYAEETCDDATHVDFQCHDFSMRGMSSVASAINSGIGHLTSFTGTDTIPAILAMEKYYNANIENEMVGSSIAATEHSVMCSYGETNELELFRHLIEDVYPSGFFSVVSDTWDLWKVCTEYLPALKKEILLRDGRVVIRPDSGDPVKILCGDIDIHELQEETDLKNHFIDKALAQLNTGLTSVSFYARVQSNIYRVEYKVIEPQDNKYHLIVDDVIVEIFEHELTPSNKGVIQLLWEVFGGTINSKGYKVLDSHIGAIYGDSITLDRCRAICERLKQKGFASSNIVYGVGSFSFQYVTRDTFSQALKATYAVVNGEERMLFKNPKTDDGTKKSQRGMVYVGNYEGELKMIDGLDQAHVAAYEKVNCIKPVFIDGVLVREDNLATIRNRVRDIL